MTILVTGATGFIGMEVVRRLNAQGVRPRVMVRRATRTALLSPLDVEPVHGDLMSAPALRRAVDGVDTIIHLAGRATFEPYDRLRRAQQVPTPGPVTDPRARRQALRRRGGHLPLAQLDVRGPDR